MGAKKYNLAEQLWAPRAVKRYTSREEMNTSVWEKTYKGNTIKKNGANVTLSINTTGGRGASVSTDQFYKDNCAIKLAANETYSITVTNDINVGHAKVIVRYSDTNDIITSVSYGELPKGITLTPNVETGIYFGVDISVGAAAVKETAMINVIRQAAWHDIDDFVRQNGAWVTEAIVSGALPLTAVKTTGEDILDYKIYGASGGVGDVTSGTEPTGYKVSMSVASNNLIDCESGWQSRLGDGTYTGDNMTGTLTLTARNWFWKVVKVKPNTNYIFNGQCTDYSLAVGYGCYGSNSGVPETTDVIFSSFAVNLPNFEFNSGNRDEIALYLYCGGSTEGTSTYTNLRISEGADKNFIPYSKTTTPIYIGSDPLGEGEYVDYGEGKIYRMSGGTLTPTDPPVSLPALPTVDGTTIVDYAGQSAAVPSRFYAKYKKG